jgi:L-2,4-diaminobutyrate decarboxylase
MDFRQHGHILVDLIADYLQSAENQSFKTVYPQQAPDEALAYWQADFENSLENGGDVQAFFKEIIQRSNHLHHPRYMGHQVPPPDPLAALTGLLTGILNNGGAVYEMGIVANPIERIITDWVARQCGYGKNGGGFLTSGGTLANLTALLTARAVMTDVWEDGNNERLAVIVSDEAHYCIDRAARIMGFGTEGVIKIPTDSRFKLKTELLEEYYQRATAKGLRVIAIVGSAGSTSTGSYDDLEAIANFAEKHKIWFHVDGAHGAAVIFSKKYKPLVRGIERADSVVLDFHKMLMTPALITALVYKNGNDAYKTFQQKAQYLWADPDSLDWFNPGKRTFECTKLMMSLKIYTLIKAYGARCFGENVDILYDLGKTFAGLIKKRPDFELAVEPETNIVCFRYLSKNKNLSDADLNALNAEIRAEILRGGEFYIVQTTLREKLYLRVTLINPLTGQADLAALLAAVERVTESHSIAA